MPTESTTRQTQADIAPQFIDRWSPRAFAPEPLTDAEVASLFEAARWAPSASNEQPWLFLYARTEEELARFRPLLVDGNRRWADEAPFLAFVFARRHFARDDKPNRWAEFDAGAAWLSLALQARHMGLYSHAMGGFHRDRIYEALGVPEDRYVALAAIVVGHRVEPDALPDDLRARERPSDRKPLAEVALQGGFSESGA